MSKKSEKTMATPDLKKRTRGQQIWHQFCKNKGSVVGMAMIIILLIVGIYAQFAYDYDTDIIGMNVDSILLFPGQDGHLIGTDHMGRDMLARLLYGAKYSILIGVLATAISTVIGVAIGAIAAYVGGKVETVMMRLVEILMMIPTVLLTIILVAVMGVSLNNLIWALSLSGIPFMARQVRAAVLPLKDSEFVEAAKALGVSDFMILMTHILPNSLSPIIVQATIRIGVTIVSASVYSFLGLGVPSPTPEWGAMLSDARVNMRQYPFLVIYPGLAIMWTTMGFNLMGDGLRDALDPKLKK